MRWVARIENANPSGIDNAFLNSRPTTFYGTSHVVDPRGRILAEASEDGDDLMVADLDLDMVREVRDLRQFFCDRRPEMYGN